MQLDLSQTMNYLSICEDSVRYKCIEELIRQDENQTLNLNSISSMTYFKIEELKKDAS